MGLDIENVRQYVQACPHLNSDAGAVTVDGMSDTPIRYGLYDNGKTVLSTTITGVRTFRHTYILRALYHTALEADRVDNNRRTHAFQDWVMEQDDRGVYPPVAAGAVEGMTSTQSVFAGHDEGGKDTGWYTTTFIIDYEEE